MTLQMKSIGLFILCFTFGISLFYSISERSLVQRDPAAINGKVFQIANLSQDQIKDHIAQKIKVFPTISGQKAIQFTGFSSSLCKTYSEVELEFQAEGIAVAGEATTMTVISPCSVGQDPSEMAQIQLPIDKILKEKPRNAEYAFDGFIAKVKIKNAADEWPRQWVLKSVHFKGQSGQDKAAYFKNENKAQNDFDRPVVLEF